MNAPTFPPSAADNLLILQRNADDWDVEALALLSQTEFLALFSTLAAPTLSEMDGEFAATLGDQGNPLSTWLGRKAIDLRGRWLGKAFTPGDGVTGHGYNSFQRPEGVARYYRMRTSITASQRDNAPCMQLDYRPYKSLFGRLNMVDEVRQIRPGLYIGIGGFGFTERGRQQPLPFILNGPVARFIGADRSEE